MEAGRLNPASGAGGSHVDSPASALARTFPMRTWALLTPMLAFLFVFILLPLGALGVRSFTDPSVENFTRLVDTPLYGDVLVRTLRTAAIVTVCSAVLGYLYAYAMYKAGRVALVILMICLLLPFWSSILVRNFSWILLLQDTGVINNLLMSLGVIDEPLTLIRTQFAVVIGMTQVLVPYLILPLYAVMRGIDEDLTKAARSLGATPGRSFRKVFFPLSLPGLLAGSLLVFVLSIGFYITPVLLGGPGDALLPQLIADQVNIGLQFGQASALAMVLLVITLLTIAIAARVLRRSGAVRQMFTL